MNLEELKNKMCEYVRGSGQIAFGQRVHGEDLVEKITGRIIFAVARKFINDRFMNEFVEEKLKKSKTHEKIYQDWQEDFGQAVYDEIDLYPLNREENDVRDIIKHEYRMWNKTDQDKSDQDKTGQDKSDQNESDQNESDQDESDQNESDQDESDPDE